jgi:hypothetical protein
MSQFQATRDPLINLSIKINDGQAVFNYSKNGEPCDGNVEVNKPEAIRYQLIDTPDLVQFVGVGFLNPFNGNINSVLIEEGGRVITINDLHKTSGIIKFQFILKYAVHSVWLISPDPQIIDRQD